MSIGSHPIRPRVRGYTPTYGGPGNGLAYRGPEMGQRGIEILDNRFISLITNSGAAVIGGIAGWKFDGGLSTAAWVLSVVAGLRAINDLIAMGNRVA